ncbi:hypothetical protein KLF50_14935 (plasmid) [Clostridium perfringens]|uniref:hypothetical protein n=1 Tax=Clostridium perfringens TaxID=1502 RepID=UPI001CC9668F|nr:hypothetical protein [Clostridium perfringens]UBK83459.1 hypothetical protein KLF50_14935 [Clostridium perfringens]
MSFLKKLEGKKIKLQSLDICKQLEEDVYIDKEMEKFFETGIVTIEEMDLNDFTFTIMEDSSENPDKWWFDIRWIESLISINGIAE